MGGVGMDQQGYDKTEPFCRVFAIPGAEMESKRQHYPIFHTMDSAGRARKLAENGQQNGHDI